MIEENQNFRINVDLNKNGTIDTLDVIHQGGVFIADLNSDKVSLINNGDNSWSLVNGVLDQESVNIIGQAIEDYYQTEKL